MKIKMFDDIIEKHLLLTKYRHLYVDCCRIKDDNIILSFDKVNQCVVGNNLIWKYFPQYVSLKRNEFDVKERSDWFKSITLYNKSTKEWELTEEVKEAEPKDWE